MLLFFWNVVNDLSVLSLVVAILPVILIGVYIYKKDRIKESYNLLIKLFIVGISSCYPAILLSLLLGSFFPEMESMNFLQMFLYVFVVIALVEEFCKWFFLYKITYNHDEFDSLYDMIVYASFVALGFACFENVLYVSSTGIVTGLVRAVTAVPGHVCDGILMGSYLALAKNNQVNGNYELSKKYKILSIFIPVITHGIYDFCLFWDNPIFIIIFIIFVISLFIICFRKIKEISKNNIKFKDRNKYCTGCGNPVNSNFCTICGKRNN